MNKRRLAEFHRLEADHPEWAYVPYDEVHRRYWMYFSADVARARAEVYRRRLAATLERVVLGGGTR